VRLAAPERVDARAIKLLTIASYSFLVGLGGVVFGLSAAMAGKGTVLSGLGVFTLVLSLVYLAAAYGLLKLENWSLLLTVVVLAISIPLSLIFIWLDPTQFNVIALTISVMIDVAAIWILQGTDVKQLYRGHSEQRAMS
jgi:uncharacterized membrane protein (DUF2068 family)